MRLLFRKVVIKIRMKYPPQNSINIYKDVCAQIDRPINIQPKAREKIAAFTWKKLLEQAWKMSKLKFLQNRLKVVLRIQFLLISLVSFV